MYIQMNIVSTLDLSMKSSVLRYRIGDEMISLVPLSASSIHRSVQRLRKYPHILGK